MVTGLIHDGSQEARILQMLSEARGDGWVSALELSNVSLQYCARICCLRKAGTQIENKLEVENGRRRGFYRLRRIAEQVALIPLTELVCEIRKNGCEHRNRHRVHSAV
jgi:hypothetical protein